MHMIMVVGERGVICWPEGTSAFGPQFEAGSRIPVRYVDDYIRSNGIRFYIVEFEDKGRVRRFEVSAREVDIVPVEGE